RPAPECELKQENLFDSLALSCVFLLSCFLATSFANENALLISTKSGKVRGKMLPVLGGEVRAFLGIPYAKPPVGNLRFRPPQPADPWQGVKDATNYGNSCFQLPDTKFPGFRGAEMWNPNTPVSEDCLYLNIWTPRVNKNQASSPLPVMIWIYGGAFTTGTTSLDLYDGRYLTKSEDVIVVSMNYSFLVFTLFMKPDNTNVRGNAGLMDQRLAIQWVVDNIAAFGGDPSQITLFGESAGSISVGLHVLSPGSNGLFKRAVMQSFVPTAPGATRDLEETWKRAIKLGTSLECPTSDPAELETCLQRVSASQLAISQFAVLDSGGYPFFPVVDGVFLPDKPEVMIKKSPPKELLIGVNKDEGSYFMEYGLPGFDLGDNNLSYEQFLDALKQYMGINNYTATMISGVYVSIFDKSPGRYRDALNNIITDALFVCPAKDFAYSYNEARGKPFLYYFQHRSSTNPWPEWMGVMHGYEIEFVFGLPLNPSLGYTQEEVNMSKRFMKYWATFARTGNPGSRGHEWPQYDFWTSYVTLDTNPLQVKMALKFAECSFWS
uniref:Carboxylic ester hydrolase n=1 Tax=Tetraodon nigroviridis TaxID=99883 RepID=H3DBR5_TETNG